MGMQEGVRACDTTPMHAHLKSNQPKDHREPFSECDYCSLAVPLHLHEGRDKVSRLVLLRVYLLESLTNEVGKVSSYLMCYSTLGPGKLPVSVNCHHFSIRRL